MKPDDKIYAAYFQSKRDNMYFNEIKEFSGLSDSSLSTTLSRLTDKNILVREKTKSNTFYKIKDRKISALKFSEIAVNKFEELNIGVKVPLRNLLNGIPRGVFTVVIFGSASRKGEGKGSDIDILVVSDIKYNLENQKKEAELTSKYPISIFYCTISGFLEAKDDVVIQAKKMGFPIFNEQNFYEAVIDGYR